MLDVQKFEELPIPDGVDVSIKSRIITVSGPRGTLTKNVRHVNMDIRLIKGSKNKVLLTVWQGSRKHVACLRTIRSMINNMITGVTKVRPPYDYPPTESTHISIYRASSTRCELFMPISQSTASSTMLALLWRSVTSWARRCAIFCLFHFLET